MLDVLKRYRAAHQMSQVELARVLGVSHITVSRWETGLRRIGRKSVPLVAAVTGIAPIDLCPDLTAPAKAGGAAGTSKITNLSVAPGDSVTFSSGENGGSDTVFSSDDD